MIERIIVPLDGSMTAEAILPQVRRVLYRNDSEIILVRAVEPPLVDNAIMMAEEILAAAREYILAKMEKLQEQGVRVRYILRFGSPARVILDAVESEKATMIALATHGTTGLKRLLFGSVAETVIRKSPVPVLLVRPFSSYDLLPTGALALRPIRNLLVPVDHLEPARQAIPGIIEFAKLFQTRIVFLRVLEGDQGAVVAPEYARAQKELEELAQECGGKGVETLRILRTGTPVDRILEAVREQEIDMIAMATHGRSGLARIREGSITEEVLRKVEVPLLITRVDKSAEVRKMAGSKSS